MRKQIKSSKPTDDGWKYQLVVEGISNIRDELNQIMDEITGPKDPKDDPEKEKGIQGVRFSGTPPDDKTVPESSMKVDTGTLEFFIWAKKEAKEKLKELGYEDMSES